MKRTQIINTIGSDFYSSNLENGEFSYPKALKKIGKNFNDISTSRTKTTHKYLDIRFTDSKLVVLVETKNKFSNWNLKKIESQLQEYVRYEKELTNKKIVAILAETESNLVYTYLGDSVIIDEKHRNKKLTKILPFKEYKEICFGKVNDKIKIVSSIQDLNDLLHSDGISEKLRSQFVGTCLLALKNGLPYKNLHEHLDKNGVNIRPNQQIINSIQDILSGLLSRYDEMNKMSKLTLLNKQILENNRVQKLTYVEWQGILNFINTNILPYINDKNTSGQDLLNIFFTTFNKYVGKDDKNQAFTPSHICDFMSKAVGVNKNSRVLDPCCGSGSFLVRAMTDAMDDCNTDEERNNVKKNQIYGIEFDEVPYGLATTNMLIHGDGNSNIVEDSIFNRGEFISDANIDIVLMNPPYNANKKQSNPEYVDSWKSKTRYDPSKGFQYVYYVAKKVSNHAKIAVLLPIQTAISHSNDIKEFKRKMMEISTLDAVFSLPDDIFHPGATVVSCCMIFDCSQSHEKADRETFFGYFKNDNFKKIKKLGRVEKTDKDGNSKWNATEEKWLDLYKNKKVEPGLSVMHKVTYEDEWVAEAYMETDYSKLSYSRFQQTTNDYISFRIKEGDFSIGKDQGDLNDRKWKRFMYTDLFDIQEGFYNKKPEDDPNGDIRFIGATESNNGVTSYCTLQSIKDSSKNGDGKYQPLEEKIFDGNAICVTNNGSVGNAYYQEKSFTCSHDVNVLYLKDKHMSEMVGLFISSVIMYDKYRWGYGRKWRRIRMINSEIALPVKKQLSDEDKNSDIYIKYGYVPDFKFMNDYMLSTKRMNIEKIFNKE